MTEQERPRYCCTTGGAIIFWFAIFAILWGGFLLLSQAVPALQPYSVPLLLTAAGVACVANFARNRTFHCIITGPAFLLLAALLALGIAGRWNVQSAFIWPLVLIVIGVALLLERRYAAG